ncbi:MAG TPA: TlpA family protein disulfide reductase [Chloroflexi bacterium]|nr:TlpA family protein disulfide reductase [Chloroflexota bacterium]
MARKKYTKSRKRASTTSPETALLRGALLIVGLFLAVWGGSMLLKGNSSGSERASAPVVGANAPSFAAETLDGKIVHLQDFRGKPVVLNFWATWCPPCRAEMPMLQQYYVKHQNDYVMLAVNDAEPASQVADFIKQKGFTFTVLLDPQQALVQMYRIQGFPTTFFIDKDGVIRYMHVGMLQEGDLRAGLQSIGVTP